MCFIFNLNDLQNQRRWTTSSTHLRLNLNAGIGESARRAFAGGQGVLRYGKKPNPKPGLFPRRAGKGPPNRLWHQQQSWQRTQSALQSLGLSGHRAKVRDYVSHSPRMTELEEAHSPAIAGMVLHSPVCDARDFPPRLGCMSECEVAV